MSRYPEIRAGQRITGNMLTGMQFQEVVKQSATSRANVTTPALDPDLQFEVEGNAIYIVEFFLNMIVEAAPSVRVSFQAPAGASGLRRIQGLTPSVEDGIGEIRSAVEEFSTQVTYGGWNGGRQTFVEESITLFTGSAGICGIAWSQEISSTTPTQMSATSYARMKRIQ